MHHSQLAGPNYFGGGSNIGRMISTAKLYEQGRNYLTAEEIRAIANGQLAAYLRRFLPEGRQYEERSNRFENTGEFAQNKVPYDPKTAELPADERPPYAVVQLDFEEFFRLM